MQKINTPGLRAGDEVVVFGATVRLEGPRIAVQAPGRNRVVYTWPNAPVVRGAISWAPEAVMWSIQGDGHRTWHVTRRGAQ